MCAQLIILLYKIKQCIYELIYNIPEKYRIICVILLWLVLFVCGCITEERVIRFIIILLIILIYKILHKNIIYIYSYVFYKQAPPWAVVLKEKDINLLLNIYKYKNPIIWLLIELEEKIFKFIHSLTKKLKPIYIYILYHCVYNLTCYTGFIIILYKFYKILNNWKNDTIYEILFKRIYGMLLSILIFTHLIQYILLLLTSIIPYLIFWIYLLLIIISYIWMYMKWPKDILTLEHYRMECNLIGTILKLTSTYRWSVINTKTKIRLNKDIKTHLWFIEGFEDLLNFKNYIKYRAYKIVSSYDNWILYEHASKPSVLYLKDMLQSKYGVFWINYIITKHHILNKTAKLKQNDIDQQVLMYCEYKILLYQLRVFYIWDVEHWIGLQNTNFKLVKETMDSIDYVDTKLISLSYAYTLEWNDFKKKISQLNIKTDIFWDLQENNFFYEKFYNHLHDTESLINDGDTEFLQSEGFKKVKDTYIFNESIDNTWTNYNEYMGIPIEIQETYLQKEILEWRNDWSKDLNRVLIYKYEKKFIEINNLKTQIIKCGNQS